MRKNRVRLTESQLHKLIKESVGKLLKSKTSLNEIKGWSLEDDDIALVNDESCGADIYMVKLWWGSGYIMDCYNAYADSEEEALNYTVAYIESNNPSLLDTTDKCAERFLDEIMEEQGVDSEDAEMTPEFEETFMYVDATMEGAEQPHWIWSENLTIAKYPAEHSYPMSTDIMKESFLHKIVRENVQKIMSRQMLREGYDNTSDILADAFAQVLNNDEGLKDCFARFYNGNSSQWSNLIYAIGSKAGIKEGLY